MKRVTLTFVLSVALFAAGCVRFTMIEPRNQLIADTYLVDSQITWSSIEEGKVEIWTVDGPTLQAVRFAKGFEDGDTLFEPKILDLPKYEPEPKQELPKFQRNMRAHGVMDFVVDSLSSIGMEQIQTKNLRPVNFGTVPGYRFEITFLTEEGLEMEGLVAGAMVDERLHLIIYYGARQYYFAKHVAHVEKIIESIRMR